MRRSFGHESRDTRGADPDIFGNRLYIRVAEEGHVRFDRLYLTVACGEECLRIISSAGHTEKFVMPVRAIEAEAEL